MSEREEAITRVAVLGAGVMGSQIAALLANAGFAVDLLDLAADGDPAGRARAGLARAAQNRPAAFFIPETAGAVNPGSLEDLSCLSRAEWVIEAIVEDLELKRTLLSRVAAAVSPTCVLSSNTSGLSIARLGEGLPPNLRARFLGIHFFNPVRHMRLVELVSGEQTDPALRGRMTRFLEDRLGKGVVACRDTPNFIANRLGVFALMDVLHRLGEGDPPITVEEADAVTGPLLGRPRTASLRLCDLIGLDILVDVARTAHDNLIGERERGVFKPPGFVERMLEAGLLGAKTGGGFYRKADDGIEALDLASFEYRLQQEPALGSLAPAAGIRDLGPRLASAYATACASAAGRLGRFAGGHLDAVLAYAADHVAEMATGLNQVDLAMRWGFNWEAGPFEIIDMIGLSTWTSELERRSRTVPALAAQIERSGPSVYVTRESEDGEGTGRLVYNTACEGHQPLPPSRDDDEFVQRGRVLYENVGGRVLVFDEGVGMILFTGKLNVIGNEGLEIVDRTLDAGFEALVVGGARGNFSAGADLAFVMGLIERAAWSELELYVARFQQAVMGLRHAPIPVVAAPLGLTLGGGCEICLASDLRIPAAELRMGLVETSVGLIPGAGGCKEMARRRQGEGIGEVFDLLCAGRFSDNALQARAWGLLEPDEAMEMNGQRIVQRALSAAASLAQGGYRPPVSGPIKLAGRAALDELDERLRERRAEGDLSAHDHLVGRLLAGVLCGRGSGTSTEQELLDLEREAFLELSQTAATRERIAHMLTTGKPLKN